MICGSCHSIDSQDRVQSDGEWILSGQQFAEWLHSPHDTASPHYGYLTCITCHDQHKSTVYDQGGLKDSPDCSSCHPGYLIPGKEYLDCIDCHMPYTVKSAREYNDNRADTRSHIMKIWVTAASKDTMFVGDSTATYLRVDDSGIAYGNTLDLVCLRCHTNMTLEEVFPVAENIHEEGLGILKKQPVTGPENYFLSQNYPNPFNASTTIEFNLPGRGFVSLDVYDLQGALTESLLAQELNGGRYQIQWNADRYSSGIYLYQISTESVSIIRKMLLIK